MLKSAVITGAINKILLRLLISRIETRALNQAVGRNQERFPEDFTFKLKLSHDSALRDLYQKRLPLLSAPPEEPKRKLGFNAEEND